MAWPGLITTSIVSHLKIFWRKGWDAKQKRSLYQKENFNKHNLKKITTSCFLEWEKKVRILFSALKEQKPTLILKLGWDLIKSKFLLKLLDRSLNY